MRRRNVLILVSALLATVFLAVLVTRDIVEDPGSPEMYGYDFVTSGSLPIGTSVRIRGWVRWSEQQDNAGVFLLVATFPPIPIEVYTNKAPANGSFVDVEGTLGYAIRFHLNEWHDDWNAPPRIDDASWHYSSPIVMFLDFVKSVTITALPFLIIVLFLIPGASLIKFLTLHRRSKRIDENLGFEYD